MFGHPLPSPCCHHPLMSSISDSPLWATSGLSGPVLLAGPQPPSPMLEASQLTVLTTCLPRGCPPPSAHLPLAPFSHHRLAWQIPVLGKCDSLCCSWRNAFPWRLVSRAEQSLWQPYTCSACCGHSDSHLPEGGPTPPPAPVLALCPTFRRHQRPESIPLGSTLTLPPAHPHRHTHIALSSRTCMSLVHGVHLPACWLVSASVTVSSFCCVLHPRFIGLSCQDRRHSIISISAFSITALLSNSLTARLLRSS